MSEWNCDFDRYDEGITSEEDAVCRWGADRDDLMPEDWEQIMGGPEDSEFEMVKDRFEAVYDASEEEQPHEMFKAETAEPDSPEPDSALGHCEKPRAVPFFYEEDIPF